LKLAAITCIDYISVIIGEVVFLTHAPTWRQRRGEEKNMPLEERPNVGFYFRWLILWALSVMASLADCGRERKGSTMYSLELGRSESVT
jgi:hypothetical protein